MTKFTTKKGRPLSRRALEIKLKMMTHMAEDWQRVARGRQAEIDGLLKSDLQKLCDLQDAVSREKRVRGRNYQLERTIRRLVAFVEAMRPTIKSNGVIERIMPSEYEVERTLTAAVAVFGDDEVYAVPSSERPKSAESIETQPQGDSVPKN